MFARSNFWPGLLLDICRLADLLYKPPPGPFFVTGGGVQCFERKQILKKSNVKILRHLPTQSQDEPSPYDAEGSGPVPGSPQTRDASSSPLVESGGGKLIKSLQTSGFLGKIERGTKVEDVKAKI